MKISLCIITGNEEAIIERFLASFAPAFHELSLCRAIGAQKPDKTAELAEAWCGANGKEYRFQEHKNGAGAECWEHVDNFASARNAAFENATGDWLVWGDCDDLLHEPEKLLEVLSSPDVGDIARFDYDVVGTNKRPTRERAIRRSAFAAGARWHFAVHENLLALPEMRISVHPSPVWVHQPKPSAPDGRKRNKRILCRMTAHTAANYFYLHQEWFCEGEHHNARKYGELALGFPDLDPSFRYEINLNLSRINPDSDIALRYALDAHGVFPWCRESMAMLCLLYIERGDPTRALHWAERMDATELPNEGRRPWTHEPKWYGWAAIDLLARCQRINDRDATATQARLGTPVFSLIHASRGRPQRAAECRNQWLNLAANPERVEHILCVDLDDRPSVRLAKQFQHVISTGQSCVAAWNLGAAASRGKILVQLSDDWVPVPGWDAKILAEVERAGKTLEDPWVLAISDGHRKDDLLCMAILSRARYEQQRDPIVEIVDATDDPVDIVESEGPPHLFASGYESVFSDNEFSHRAFRDGVVIDARPRLTFHHMHPAFGAGKMDATYEHNNQRARYERGLETFKRRNPDAFDGKAKP